MTTPLKRWVEEQARLTKPDRIYWCNGSEQEARELIRIGREQEKVNGVPVFEPVNPAAWPNAFYHRSHPTDVARAEHLTFVCHPDKETAGPNNNWMAPDEAKRLMTGLSDGCMRGKTMYVLPYMMGHPDSPYAKACIQLTDLSYVAVSMRIMTRMGKFVLDRIGSGDKFVRGLHSVGDFDPKKRYIMHFPDEQFVWSIGSGYGGNALLGKKCFSLRIASWLGLKEGWLAEHMVIMEITDPQGAVSYVAAAFPSACGKTNMAMMEAALPGYTIRTIGDDIAWLNIGPDGRLRAINPEAGFFGVAPGTSAKTNPNMLRTLKNDRFFPTLFTNTALVGRAYRHAPGPAAGLAGQSLDAGIGDESVPPQRPVHRIYLQLSRPFPRVRRPERRSHFGHHRRRPPGAHHPARGGGVQLAARRVPCRPHGIGNDRRCDEQGRRRAPRSHGHASLLRVQHG
jgi:phosphoenolpyruvate carboxykinase (GTP)